MLVCYIHVYTLRINQMKECPELDCDQSRQYKVPGECCPRCAGKQTAIVYIQYCVTVNVYVIM